MTRVWMTALPLALLLAGCGGGSVVPGQGGNGGLGTGGTGTGDPNGTLSFRLRGMIAPDYEASEVRATASALGFQVQGTQPGGTAKTPTSRIATIRFNGLPVQGVTYTVAGNAENSVVFEYAERDDTTRKIKLWEGVSGQVHVDKVTQDHVTGTFGGALDGAQNVTGEITASGGEFAVQYQQ
jgi:hypothetical protein